MKLLIFPLKNLTIFLASKSNILCAMTTTRMIFLSFFLLIYNVVPVVGQIDFSKLPNLCPVDKQKFANVTGNGYFCPDVYDDGSPNPYVECCHNDRPDEKGNYHSCCKPAADKEEEKWNKVEFIAIYIGVATSIIIVFVCAFVYCRKDTLQWLDGCVRKARYRKDKCLDGVCSCCCARSRATESERYKLNQVTPVKHIMDDPVITENLDLFWNPNVANEVF